MSTVKGLNVSQTDEILGVYFDSEASSVVPTLLLESFTLGTPHTLSATEFSN